VSEKSLVFVRISGIKFGFQQAHAVGSTKICTSTTIQGVPNYGLRLSSGTVHFQVSGILGPTRRVRGRTNVGARVAGLHGRYRQQVHPFGHGDGGYVRVMPAIVLGVIVLGEQGVIAVVVARRVLAARAKIPLHPQRRVPLGNLTRQLDSVSRVCGALKLKRCDVRSH